MIKWFQRVTCSICGGKYKPVRRDKSGLRYPHIHNEKTGKYLETICQGSFSVCSEDIPYI